MARAKPPAEAPEPADQTTAVVIEREEVDLVVQAFTVPAEIEANFDALQAHVEKIAKDYAGLIVTPEYYQQAKKDRAALNSLVKEIDQRRLAVKRQLSAPITAFENRVKLIVEPAKLASENIDRQIKAFDDQEKIEKRVRIVEFWSNYAGALADAVDFEKLVFDEKWLNKSVDLGTVFSEIEKLVERIIRDDERLSTMPLEYRSDVKARYFATLDLSEALQREEDLKEEKRRADELEASKQRFAAERAASAEPEPAVDDDSDLTTYEVRHPGEAESSLFGEEQIEPLNDFTISIKATRTQLGVVMDYLRSVGIEGKAARA